MEPTQGLLGLLTKIGLGNIGLVTAAFLGALLSPVVIGKQSLPQMLLTIAVGFFSSVYGTPLCTRYLGLDGDFAYGLAFFIGLFSMSLIPAVQAFLKRKLEAKS